WIHVGCESVVRLLLTRDPDVNSKDNDGRSALWWASFCGREEVVKLLLERKDIEIDSADNKGRTALSMASGNGHTSIVNLLEHRQKSKT
ncbi:ankyrin repeat-containing domain protein, partial [Pyronema domesticum]